MHDGLWCAIENQHMGLAAEWMAEACQVGRQDQDQWALVSHQRAVAARDAGHLRDEIVAVPLPQRKGPPVMFESDEAPRRDTTLAALAALRPAFKEGGTVTAGNAPGVTDGAAALVLARRVCGRGPWLASVGPRDGLVPGRRKAVGDLHGSDPGAADAGAEAGLRAY